MFGQAALLSAFAGSALAGTILWDGRFNDMTSSADLNNWSWSNEVGSYQYYIHGSGAVTEYVNLSPSYKNPADTGSKQGAKITIDSTSLWNSNMWRTELIPQTTAAINKGKVWYHFSMMRSGTNNPSIYNEHQVCFFESHFTEMKYGWINGESGTSDANLQWMVGGVGKWEVIWDANVWHNIAYEIDFSGGTVSFWHSTGSDALTLTAGPFTASASSNGEDWHLGVLRLPRDGYTETTPEDWYFSGVYVESGSLTTAIGNGSSSSTGTGTGTTGTTTSAPASNPTTSKAATPTTSSTSSGSTGTAAEWAQCGGIGYSGPTTCASGYTCHVVNDYYSQCY